MDLEAYLGAWDERDWEDEAPAGTLDLAVVGLDDFARGRALPAIEASDYCDPAAVVSGSAGKAERAAEEYGANALTYDAFRDGAATDAYDAVYVVTPNARHLEFAASAADLGKHVLCEKPLEATPDRAGRLVDACEEAGVTLMTAYRMQTHPAVRRLRAMLRDGLVGDPVLVHGNFSTHSMRGGRGPDHWRYDPDLAGGGALMDVGVYPVNTARFLLGTDPERVSAMVETPDEAFAGVDEHVSVQASFPGAVLATFTASFDAQGDSRLHVVGSAGAVRLEWAFPTVEDRVLTIARGGVETETRIPAVNEIVEEFDYFAYHALTGRSPEPDGRDGLRDVEVMAAAYRAAEEGTRVAVD